MIKQVLKMKRSFTLIAMLMLFAVGAFAQQGGVIAVKGSVVDGSGEGLIGATVRIKGDASSGTVTVFDGNFSI